MTPFGKLGFHKATMDIHLPPQKTAAWGGHAPFHVCPLPQPPRFFPNALRRIESTTPTPPSPFRCAAAAPDPDRSCPPPAPQVTRHIEQRPLRRRGPRARAMSSSGPGGGRPNMSGAVRRVKKLSSLRARRILQLDPLPVRRRDDADLEKDAARPRDEDAVARRERVACRRARVPPEATSMTRPWTPRRPRRPSRPPPGRRAGERTSNFPADQGRGAPFAPPRHHFRPRVDNAPAHRSSPQRQADVRLVRRGDGARPERPTVSGDSTSRRIVWVVPSARAISAAADPMGFSARLTLRRLVSACIARATARPPAGPMWFPASDSVASRPPFLRWDGAAERRAAGLAARQDERRQRPVHAEFRQARARPRRDGVVREINDPQRAPDAPEVDKVGKERDELRGR